MERKTKDIDPQKDAVYSMEVREFRGLWRRTRIPLAYRRQLVKMLCRLYKLEQIGLYSLKIRGYSGLFRHDEEGGKHIEVDHRSGQDLLILAHEFAHYMTWTWTPRAQDHGPTFARNYMLACASLRLIPQAGFRAAARKHGVKIATSCRR
jgi:hypothetical protein